MKLLSPLLVLALIFNSCSKPPDLQTYKDPSYPIAIKYKPNKMDINPFLSERDNEYWISVTAKFGDEFPDDYAGEFVYDLYRVIIFRALDEFKKFEEGTVGGDLVWEETSLNGVPAVAIKDPATKEPYRYILFTPGQYSEVWLSGINARRGNPDEISQKFSDRVKEYTYEMIKHFRWTQPIDTNSAEFKAWKAHIWEILESSPVPQKSNVKM